MGAAGPWIARREQFGAYHVLMSEMEGEYPESYVNFVRMDTQHFQQLLVAVTTSDSEKGKLDARYHPSRRETCRYATLPGFRYVVSWFTTNLFMSFNNDPPPPY